MGEYEKLSTTPADGIYLGKAESKKHEEHYAIVKGGILTVDGKSIDQSAMLWKKLDGEVLPETRFGHVLAFADKDTEGNPALLFQFYVYGRCLTVAMPIDEVDIQLSLEEMRRQSQEQLLEIANDVISNAEDTGVIELITNLPSTIKSNG